MTDNFLLGPVTSTAYGWRLERRDGVTMAFTSHDFDIRLDGLLHLASPGMQPGSVLETIGLETDGLEVTGNLNFAAIRPDDLGAGRWNGARLTIYQFDWDDPQAGKRIIASGELGEVSYSRDAFQADLRGLTASLDHPVVPQTSPSCRADFCDGDCGLNRARFAHELMVTSVVGDRLIFGSALPGILGGFAFGRLRWLSGANCGLWSDIMVSDASSVTLTVPPPFPLTTPEHVELVEGCDKTLNICSGRFANAINFRGEPFLPGNDLLTRYPGAA